MLLYNCYLHDKISSFTLMKILKGGKDYNTLIHYAMSLCVGAVTVFGVVGDV